jgi:mannan endo-1,4-beta-mannosidase
MRRSLALFLFVLFACDNNPEASPDPEAEVVAEVAVDVDADAGRVPISPLIYGTNQDLDGVAWTIRRMGGNRMTGYNWENNYSNAGSDFQHSSDRFVAQFFNLGPGEATIPGRAVAVFHDRSRQLGAESIVTLQLAGYVSRDDFGTVSVAETAPSARWVRAWPRKGAAFDDSPNPLDAAVYMDEFVAWLVRRYGDAQSGGSVRFYSLDNEPALWAFTHPRIVPEPIGAVELADRSIELMTAVKDVDPAAEILGAVLYGFAAFLSLQEAPDWPSLSGTWTWYVDYFLARMRAAGDAQSRRLLDVLDVHWYPEARGDNRITDGGLSEADVEARLQAPRSLWDPTYEESSWIADCCSAYLPILPRLKSSIAAHYPGTKLAVTEYDFGAGASISGGLAQADVLGVFGREGVYISTRWGIEPNHIFAASAFNLYRNYDAAGGQFGDTSVLAAAANRNRLSVYASIEGDDADRLHIVLINKSTDGAVAATFTITSDTDYTGAEVWGFRSSQPTIARKGDIGGIAANRFRFVVQPLEAVHLVLE